MLFANTDWYIYNFRRSLAVALRGAGHEVVLVSPPGLYGEKLGGRLEAFARGTAREPPEAVEGVADVAP